MKEKTKLVNKVKRLIRKAGLPRWLHHYGPKKYEFWHHSIAYIVKQECKLGYRRVTRLLRWLGIKCPCPSALCTSFNKIPLQLWQKLLAATASNKINIAAIDATGMSRTLPSPYYYKRIDKPYPVEIPLKFSLSIDTKAKKILSLRLRSKKAHDIRDFKYLIRRLPSKPKKVVADKGYDANWAHEFCYSLSILAVIPARNYGSKKILRNDTRYRKRGMKLFRKRTYNRREIIEAVISAFKRKFGASVSSVKYSAQRAELYSRAITHNIIFCFYRLFERGLAKNAIYLNYKFNGYVMQRGKSIESLLVTVIASLILIAMGIVYFIATLWIIKFSSNLLGYTPDANWAVLSAAIVVVGIMVGSAIKNA